MSCGRRVRACTGDGTPAVLALPGAVVACHGRRLDLRQDRDGLADLIDPRRPRGARPDLGLVGFGWTHISRHSYNVENISPLPSLLYSAERDQCHVLGVSRGVVFPAEFDVGVWGTVWVAWLPTGESAEEVLAE